MNHSKYWHQLDTPIGPLLLVGGARHLCRIGLQGGTHPEPIGSEWQASAEPFGAAIAQLQQYFARERREFDLPLAAEGTPFQRTVWRELQRIPYGTTISYGELARRLGNPHASRAVGLANGANPLPIVIPCHRVIGADGSLTGFGGGLHIKRALLALEQADGARDLFSDSPAGKATPS